MGVVRDGKAVPRTTIVRALAERVSSDPDGPYLDFEGDVWSAGRIDDTARRVAAGLAALGVGRGDRVASLLGNGPEQVVTFFATLQLGAIAVPINTAYKGEFLRHQLADSGACVLVLHQDFVDRAEAVLGPGTPALGAVVVVADGEAASALAAGSPAVRSWRDVVSSDPLDPADVPESSPADLACLIYTAGTTGPSKGCMLPHNYVVSMADQIARAWERRADDIVWTPLPLFHLNAISVCVVGTLLTGGSASIAGRFSVSGFWPEMRRSAATMVSMLGSLAILLAEADDHPETKHHRLRLCAAAPMPPATDEAWRSRFGCATFSAGFGMTEAGLLSLLPAGEPNKPGAAGRLNDVDFEVALLDDEDQEVPVGEDGEICCRPRRPDVMFAGYWGRPEATVEAWRNLWFHTGDLGRVDEDGFLFFVDRKKDSLRRRGENISSFEIEKTLHSHPDIRDAAVHAVPSEVAEDDVKVTVVCNDGSDLTEEALCRWIAERVPYFAIPRYVEFRDDLPRNPVGRVLKFQLREEGVTEATWDREAAGVTFERR